MLNLNERAFVIGGLARFRNRFLWAVPAKRNAGKVRLTTEINNGPNERASVNFYAAVRTGDAGLRASGERELDRDASSELSSPAFPYRGPSGFGPRGSSGHSPRVNVSDGPR
jgi:hypothetical protein